MSSNKDYLSGTLSVIILALLKEHNRMYGYEICQRTKELTDSDILLTEGAIYPALHKMEKKGFIISSKEKINGRVRKYYSIDKGASEEVSLKIESLAVFINHLQTILKPALK